MGNDERLEDAFRQILGLGIVFWDAIKEDTPRQEIRTRIELLAETMATVVRQHQNGDPLDLTADFLARRRGGPDASPGG